MEYHKQLLTLHLRQNPKEVLIGWYLQCYTLADFVGTPLLLSSIRSLHLYKTFTIPAKEEHSPTPASTSPSPPLPLNPSQ